MDEGSKSKQEEGDIKEKLVHSTLNKDLVSRNEKVQVQVKTVHTFMSRYNLSKLLLCCNFQLVSRNKKVQVQLKRVHVLISCHNLSKHLSNMGFQALRQRYKDVKMRNLENAAKLRRLKFFSAYVVPAILTGEILKRLFLIPS